ncbi:hypothetical protein BCR34DRAFT_266122 [Clohesyomyces aquaticus]|uniref:Uncharacterized protein n=1 Tax=Clohesyomyces aquaticus TaxID=1231657 RepID=A0A1Y1Y2F9_9PLEO|nr:hypothetical protein BCR34DRAFT_266122 [Clohesyomyces aquaticus]
MLVPKFRSISRLLSSLMNCARTVALGASSNDLNNQNHLCSKASRSFAFASKYCPSPGFYISERSATLCSAMGPLLGIVCNPQVTFLLLYGKSRNSQSTACNSESENRDSRQKAFIIHILTGS